MGLFMYLLSRLTERSTWLGVTAVLSAGGVTIAPELTNSIISIGMGAAGVIGVITKDKEA